VHIVLYASPRPSSGPFIASSKVPLPSAGGFSVVPPISSPSGVSRVKPAPLAHIGLQAPQACDLPLSRTLQPPAAVSLGFPLGPTDIAPVRGNFWFRPPNRPPSRISSFRPPRPTTCPSPALYNPLLLSAWGLPQVSPLSRPGGAIVGFTRQTTLPCASRAPGPPGPALTSLPHTTTPRYCQLGVCSRSYRYRATQARYSVSRAKPPHLGHIDSRPPQPFKPALGRIP
jgi:hypothetical protein